MMKQLHIETSSDDDRKQVERTLVSVAERFSMLDATVTSRVPNTIRCYTEVFGGGFAFGARLVVETIVVDLNPGNPVSPRYQAFEEIVVLELRRLFGSRFHIPQEADFIEIQSTLAGSEAAREFLRKHSRIKPPLRPAAGDDRREDGASGRR